MASIARSFRPLASRMTTRPCGKASSWKPTPLGIRSFSASSTVQVKRYTKDHEWIELSADKKYGTIGISEYAAHALGDVVYVELPTVPMKVAPGDAIGAVESVKSASDINAPISCTITAVNEVLEEAPGTINKGPEDTSSGGGWVAKVDVSEAGVKDLDTLMDEAAYKDFTAE
ncbi:hypothetical protein B7494_g2089 [Chlorociboria aeruginascens]|nr:hypothetical protein B7494_g2089 [Chlorociboria aeruginascens]